MSAKTMGLYEGSQEVTNDVNRTLDALRSAQKDGRDLNQVLIEQVQQEMKDHPYMKGQISAYTQLLKQGLSGLKDGCGNQLLPNLELSVDKAGHAHVKDNRNQRDFEITMSSVKQGSHEVLPKAPPKPAEAPRQNYRQAPGVPQLADDFSLYFA